MLFEAFAKVAGTLPSSSGVTFNGVMHPYSQIAERAARLGSGLLNFGISPGDAVVLLSRNSPDYLVIAQALMAIGAVGVPLDVQGNPTELVRSLEMIKVRAIISAPEFATVAEQLAASAGISLPVLVIRGAGDHTIEALEKTAPGPLPTVGADADAFFLYSSGSTGRPKVVPRTHGQIVADAPAASEALGFRLGERLINILPTQHAFGLLVSVVYAPLTGTTSMVWVPNRPLMLARGELLQFMADQEVTLIPGVPFLYDLMIGATEEVKLPRVRTAFSGAVALRKGTFDNFLSRFGIAIRQALGTTETSVVSYNSSEDPIGTWNSVGTLVGDTKVDVVAAEESNDPEIGELLISSPAVTKGYLNNPEANRASFKDGAWVSGDLGRIDKNGNLYITGRKKLMLEVAGLKIDPVEVEDVLLGHPAVSEVVVVGVPDHRTGEQRLKAVVVKKADETADGLIKYAQGLLTSHKVPYLVEFRDAIPRSVTGKVLRGKLVD